MTTISIVWVPHVEWRKTCEAYGEAPINRAFYHWPSGKVYARVGTGKPVLWHEMGHPLEVPDEKHPELPAKPTLKDYLKSVPAYFKHARKVGFDSRAGSAIFRWRGPRHGQDMLLGDVMENPVDLEQWKAMRR